MYVSRTKHYSINVAWTSQQTQYCPRLLQFPRMRMTPERRSFRSPMQCNQRNTCRKCRFTTQLLPPVRASNNSDETEDPSTISWFLPFLVSVFFAPRTGRPVSHLSSRLRFRNGVPRIVSLGHVKILGLQLVPALSDTRYWNLPQPKALRR